MVTREELYRLIWAMPMTKVSAQLGISYGKLVQICTALDVPRPAQGHWTRLELGKADPVPPLPAAAEGKPTTWTGDGMRLPKPRPAARAPRKKAITGTKTPPAMHTLLRGTKAQFLNSRPARDDGFLRPYKRALPDLRTSSAALDRGLLLANALYNAFEEAGHHVVLSGLNSAARRLQIDPREAPIKGRQYDPYPQPWRPDRPTLVQTGGVSIGLIVLEMTEHVKMRYTNNGFVRDSPELAARLERSHGSGWTTLEDVPSGRLRVVAYAADSAVDWSQSWQESEDQRIRQHRSPPKPSSKPFWRKSASSWKWQRKPCAGPSFDTAHGWRNRRSAAAARTNATSPNHARKALKPCKALSSDGQGSWRSSSSSPKPSNAQRHSRAKPERTCWSGSALPET